MYIVLTEVTQLCVRARAPSPKLPDLIQNLYSWQDRGRHEQYPLLRNVQNVCFERSVSFSVIPGLLPRGKAAEAWNWPFISEVKKEWSYDSSPSSASVACTRKLPFIVICPRALGRRGDYILYGGAKYLWILTILPRILRRFLDFWNIFVSRVDTDLVVAHIWFTHSFFYLYWRFFHLLPRLRILGVLPLCPLYNFGVWVVTTLRFHLCFLGYNCVVPVVGGRQTSCRRYILPASSGSR
jgi:hypothetical protein